MRKESFATVFIIILGIAFAFVSLFVFFHPGLRIIRLKIRIGALLLSIAGIVTSCGHRVHCYSPMPTQEDTVFINQNPVENDLEDRGTDTISPQDMPEEEAD